MSDEKANREEERFWVQDPSALLTRLYVFPTADMSKNEKLNALTRLSLIVTGLMYWLKYEHWFTFLLLAVLIIVLLKYGVKTKENGKGHNKKEGFTVTPTYDSTDFQQTTVAPTFAEEWQIPPPSYDIYTSIPAETTFYDPPDPRSYPYGQYLTKTNQLPSDEYNAHVSCGGLRDAREYINSSFTRHDLAFRDNMTRIFKKSLERAFRHNCNDTFSPYHSY